jgi:hypothetical protein
VYTTKHCKKIYKLIGRIYFVCIITSSTILDPSINRKAQTIVQNGALSCDKMPATFENKTNENRDFFQTMQKVPTPKVERSVENLRCW